MTASTPLFPALPLEEWEDTKNTLHLFLQIVGKIRLSAFPAKNHWWHAPLYVSVRGLTTGPIPYHHRQFELEFDFLAHVLHIRVTDGTTSSVPLTGVSVAEFYAQVFARLADAEIDITIHPVPYDMPAISTIPFADDHTHATYDPVYAQRHWLILSQVDGVFQAFRGRFGGKSTPVHLFWHHFDLALTWFSGKRGPHQDTTNQVERDAYSHEVISFGFWAGDAQVRAPAFYAYAYPAPDGMFTTPLQPTEAFWNAEAGMAALMYDALRVTADPRQALLDFLESVYRGAAEKAGWDIPALAYTPLQAD